MGLRGKQALNGYTDVICRGYCNFYKPGKEPLKCGSLCFLERNLSNGEVRQLAQMADGKTPEFSKDRHIKSIVCSKCDFLKDGCDFRMGVKSPPCGGYTLLEQLFKTYSPLSGRIEF